MAADARDPRRPRDADEIVIASPLQGTVVSLAVAPGDVVRAGQAVAVLESMKMEHVVEAEAPGRVAAVLVAVDETVGKGQPLLRLATVDHREATPDDTTGRGASGDSAADGAAGDRERETTGEGEIRPDLAAVLERHAVGLDERRPDAVARRRRTNQRTARENLAELLDPGSFVEYGPLVIAAQRRRRSVEELIEHTPADGLVAGVGTVNGQSVVVASPATPPSSAAVTSSSPPPTPTSAWAARR
jgi:pyruvate/2-oxoglutarate dehydrogenase complex dihydrolipoamide acyltransferase (E2) component